MSYFCAKTLHYDSYNTATHFQISLINISAKLLHMKELIYFQAIRYGAEFFPPI
jgi:hypothetical protein